MSNKDSKAIVAVGGKKSGVDNTSRRTWDKEEFRQKANERDRNEKANEAFDARKRKRLERDPLHNGVIVERSELQQRNFQIDLASRLGKTQVVGANTPLNQQAGYYCAVCDCVLRDSMSYLDHINGKWHNRALGMTMRVEKSTVEQVRMGHVAMTGLLMYAWATTCLPYEWDTKCVPAQSAVWATYRMGHRPWAEVTTAWDCTAHAWCTAWVCIHRQAARP